MKPEKFERAEELQRRIRQLKKHKEDLHDKLALHSKQKIAFQLAVYEPCGYSLPLREECLPFTGPEFLTRYHRAIDDQIRNLQDQFHHL